MTVLYITKDRESDLYLWQKDRPSAFTGNKKKQTFDCSIEEDLLRFQRALTNISLFSEEEILIAHNVPYSKELTQLIETTSNEVYIVSGSGRWSAFRGATKVYTEPISDQKVKVDIVATLKKQGIPQEKNILDRIYSSVTVKNPIGKERLSPLLAETLMRQLSALDPTEKDFQQQYTYLLENSHTSINQWRVLDYLFSQNKAEQFSYFSELTKTISPFELIAQIKSMLFLIRAIVTAVKEGLDAKTIATKLGKHPFYISSLLQTAKSHGLSPEKIDRFILRFMKLEHALKSGAFEDELFGFEILLAT